MPGFRRKFPDQRRARVLFSKANDGLNVHPTQAVGAGAFTSNTEYFTGNGVCACASATGCQQDVSYTENCGFLDTVRSLHDQAWRESKVTDTDVCKKQVDWPYTGGRLRDGTNIYQGEFDPGHRVADKCGLLPRLPVYDYRYMAGPLTAPPLGSKTTLSQGGDCHTGRLAQTNDTTDPTKASLGPECHLLHRNSSHLVVGCKKDDDSVETMELPRKRADTPTVVMERVHTLRRRCSQCSAAPTFHTPDMVQLPVAESSVTHPFRLSTQRVLASNLRNDLARVMCDSLDGCQELEALINRSHWVPSTFWNSFVNDARALLNNTHTLAMPPPTTLAENVEGGEIHHSEREADEDLWSHPWLYCHIPQVECKEVCETVTGRCDEVCTKREDNEFQCSGTMSRQVKHLSFMTSSTCMAFADSRNPENRLLLFKCT